MYIAWACFRNGIVIANSSNKPAHVTFQQLGIDYAAMGALDPSLNIGICLPNSCSDKDVTIMMYKRKSTGPI